MNVNQTLLPPNKLSRRYHCEKCQLSTTRSRLFLFHGVLFHKERQPVYLCVHCEYASRWRCKVVRHHSMAHKERRPVMDQQVPLLKADEVARRWIQVDRDMDRLLAATGPARSHQAPLVRTQLNSSQSQLHHCSVSDCQFSSHSFEEFLFHRNNHCSRDVPRDFPTSSGHIQLPSRASSQPVFPGQLEPLPSQDQVVSICMECSIALDSPAELENHMKEVHNHDSAMDLSVSDGTKQDDTFMDSMETDASQCSSPGPVIRSSGRKYRCSSCSATFDWHGNLVSHLERVHNIVRSGRNPRGEWNEANKCEYCEYNAKYDSELQRHMRLHLGLKPFKCRFCPYESAWKGDLKRHLESHHRKEVPDEQALAQIMAEYKNNAGTGAFSYSSSATTRSSRTSSITDGVDDSQIDAGSVSGQWLCTEPECGYRASRPDKLLLHVSGHQERKLFRCTTCHMRFNWSMELSQHVLKVHPECDLESVIKVSKCEAAAAAQAAGETTPTCCSVLQPQLQESNNQIHALSINGHFAALTAPDSSRTAALLAANQLDNTTNKDVLFNCTTTVRSSSGGLVRKNRRFQCNVCGHRSNWKWDINKHIKVAHPVTPDAHTITLGHVEAEETLESYLAEAASKPKPKEDARLTEEGYNRPHMCSKCGHRSNWKWDINKHIRQMHPGEGHPVTLSNDIAKKTLQEYIENKKQPQEIISNAAKQVSNLQTAPRIDNLRLKRFRCTVCGYRSNYRSDIVRHIKRKHGLGQVEVMSPETAEHTLETYVKKFPQKTNAFFRKSLPAHLRDEVATLAAEEAHEKQQKHLQHVANSGHKQRKQMVQLPKPSAVISRRSSDGSFSDARSYYEEQDGVGGGKCVAEGVELEEHYMKYHSHEKHFTCRFCGAESFSKADLEIHLKENHNKFLEEDIEKDEVELVESVEDAEDEAPLDLSQKSSSSQHKCELCQHVFQEPFYERFEHLHRVHDPQSDEDMMRLFWGLPVEHENHHDYLRCTQCPFTTSYQELLAFHGNLHKSDCHFPFKCDVIGCEYRSSQLLYLERHTLLHNQVDDDATEQSAVESEVISASLLRSVREKLQAELSHHDVQVCPPSSCSPGVSFSPGFRKEADALAHLLLDCLPKTFPSQL